MPITAERAKLYPADWPDIARRVKDEAGWHCSACGAPPFLSHILTVHHLDGDPTNNDDWNLHALCQRCHLTVEHWPLRGATTRPMFNGAELKRCDPLLAWFEAARARYLRCQTRPLFPVPVRSADALREPRATTTRDLFDAPRRTRVVHCEREAYDVLVARPSRWGNPFRIGKGADRAAVIARYRVWLLAQPELLARLPELRGKVLGCWCAPLPCHGDVLAELADALPVAGGA